MLESIKQRLGRDDEQGFTLIELMVVVLIIAILLAIAIPTFLGAKNTANARGAQSSLRNGLTAEQTYFTNNNQQFGTSSTTPAMSSIEPNLTWLGAVPTAIGPNSVYSYTLDSGLQVELQSWAKDNNCYIIVQNNDPNVTPTNGNTGYAEQKGGCPAVITTFPASLTAGNASGSASTTSGGTFYTAW